MALSKEQVGLVFKLEADGKAASADIVAFQKSLSNSVKTIEVDSERSFRRVGESATGSSRIAKEGFITASSEIIESWGVDGDIANELGRMLYGLPIQAKLAIAGVVAAFIAGAAAIGIAVAAAKQMVDVAEEIGTDSKDDFEKFAKSVKAAGGEVTQLDRAMSQDLMRSVDLVKGATDNLFLVLIRESGPELIGLLRQVAQLLRDAAPLAQQFGQILSAAFIAAGASLKTFGQLLVAFKTALTGSPQGVVEFVKAIVQFDQAVEKAVRTAAEFTPAAATGFKGKGKSPRDVEADLAKARQDFIIQAAQREIELAERLFKDKALFAEDYVRIVEESELKILAAKQETFAAERAEIERSKASQTEKDAKRQQITNDEVKAIQDTERRISEVRRQAREAEKKAADEELKDQQERDKKRLDQLRDFLRQRNELIEAQGKAQVNTAEARARDLEERARTQPRFNEAARAARQAAELAELEFQRRLFFIKLNAAEQELLLLATTEQQKADISARYDELRLEAVKQFQIKRQEIEDQSRRLNERADSLSARSIFGDGFADMLAADTGRLKAFQAMFADWQASLQEQLEQMPSLAETAFGAITAGLEEMAIAFVLTGQTGPAAMRQLAAGVLAAIAKMAATKAIYELAEGFAALARGFFGDPRGFVEAGHHFTAAAIYGAVAAVSGLAGRAVAPASGGGGGEFNTGGRGNNGPRIIEQGDRGKPQVIIVHLRAETEEGVVVRRVVDDYNNNGPIRQTFGKG